MTPLDKFFFDTDIQFTGCLVFSSANSITGLKLSVCASVSVCVCLDLGGTDHNCCAWRLVILNAQTYWRFAITNKKLVQSDLVYWVHLASSSSSSIIVRPLSLITTMGGVHTAQGM